MLLAYAKYQAIAAIRFPTALTSQEGCGTIHCNREEAAGANASPARVAIGAAQSWQRCRARRRMGERGSPRLIDKKLCLDNNYILL